MPQPNTTKLENGLRATNAVVSQLIPLFGLIGPFITELILAKRARGENTTTLEQERDRFNAGVVDLHAANAEFHRLFPEG